MKAIVIEKDEAGYRAAVKEADESGLPLGDVTVAVDFSTLNYKDSLAITGRGPVVKQFPMVPGVDFAGSVIHSAHSDFKTGDKVILNGWGVGEKQWGGMAEKARVNGDWLVPLPSAFTPEQAMAIGTAGYTAMLCVDALAAQGVKPEAGEIAVSGATGGVGSVAVALLAKRGYRVVAITGKPELDGYLKEIGAAEIIDRHSLPEKPRPLEKERWAGVVDAAGGKVLATLCAQSRYDGVVTACGLAGGGELNTTVMPFILRGVTLVGIDSVFAPKKKRLRAWDLLARELDLSILAKMTRTLSLSETIEAAPDQLDGKLHGRIVVDVRR